MATKDFVMITKIGDGAYSVVYKVKRVSDGQIYALKKVKMQALSEKEKNNALNEVRILASINHQNIIAYKEAFFEDSTSSLCLVMEFADDGDLYQKIISHQKSNTSMAENFIWTVLIHMVKALKVLHQMKIFHRDLKSANVFLCKDGNAKLGDLNVSKVAKKGLLYTQTGTPYYASPEVWRDQPYDSKSDIWSLGCVLYEMTTLKPPFRANDMNGLYKRVLKGAYPKISPTYTQDLATMIKTLLQVEPGVRPTCDQILAMDIIKKRMPLMKNLPADPEITVEEAYANLNLLNTIKLPKNLANLTKDLPKSNYISNRGDSAALSIPPGSKKLVQSHPGQLRLQSEPVLPNSRQLPSIYHIKESKYSPTGGALSDSDAQSMNKLSSDQVIIKPQKRSKLPNTSSGQDSSMPGQGRSRALDIIQENTSNGNKQESQISRHGGDNITPMSRGNNRRLNKPRESNTYDPPPAQHYNYHYQNPNIKGANGGAPMNLQPETMEYERNKSNVRHPKIAINKADDFLADLRLPQVSDSGLSIGLGGPTRAQKVLDKARLQQVEMERRVQQQQYQQQQKRSLENIYLSNAKGYEPTRLSNAGSVIANNPSQYGGGGGIMPNSRQQYLSDRLGGPVQSLPHLGQGGNMQNQLQNVDRLKKSYERVNPSSYGYSLPQNNISSHQQQQNLYNQVSQEYKVIGPVISTHNERAVRDSGAKPSWWG